MILFLTDRSPCYGADYLYHGFCSAFGIERLVDCPVKPSLHGKPAGFDCDLDCPWPSLAKGEHDRLADGDIELLVVPTLRGEVLPYMRWLAARGLLAKVRDCTVCYDAEDHALNTRQHFVDALGYEPAAYFKRELPIGATWATPLPFGYPEERIVSVGRDRMGFIYSAYLWPWTRGGMREQLADGLRSAMAHGTVGTVLSTDVEAARIPLVDLHQLQRWSLVAVSPAGAGWGTNRHLEIIADGCAPIIQRPTVEFPDAFHAGTECLYFSTADEAVSHVRTLLGDPAYAIGMAQAAQAKLRSHHTTSVRARTVWGSVHGNG